MAVGSTDAVSDAKNESMKMISSPDEPQRHVEDEHDRTSHEEDSSADEGAHASTASGKPKPRGKDVSRPRRRKARRACYACQRAHLTCGDERPCQRCIKRGLRDQCTDGVRKKAKYLHDTPLEALLPPPPNDNIESVPAPRISHANHSMSIDSLVEAATYHSQPRDGVPSLYSAVSQREMPPPTQITSMPSSFATAPRPVSPSYRRTSVQSTSQFSALGSPMLQAPSNINQFNSTMFDSSDPALFNFDIASLNFGNHYGALEFGMLDQMASRAFDGMNDDQMGSVGPLSESYSLQQAQTSFGDRASTIYGSQGGNWAIDRGRQMSNLSIGSATHGVPATLISADRDGHGMPQGFAIGAGSGSLSSASPGSHTHDTVGHVEEPAYRVISTSNTEAPSHRKPSLSKSHRPPPGREDLKASRNDFNPLAKKRPHDHDNIYETVTQPYSYTNGFHRLLHFIKRRFSADKRIRIAKALATVRPSLITFSQQLTHRDLVFMEVSVQRKLSEYIHFIGAYGTPTIITRRDGAIIAASKEFIILTGWRKNVLLGLEPNMNVNIGIFSDTSMSSTESGLHPRTSSFSGDRNDEDGPGPSLHKDAVDGVLEYHQPVLVAELLDQDSIVEFYEDYAKLALRDSAGHAMRRGKLVKYRTRDDEDAEITSNSSSRRKAEPMRQGEESQNVDSIVSTEAAMNMLGEEEGLVDCMIIWNVRRDIFEVPMLIVMNFLPVI